MQCPSCGNKQTSNLECERCGIIFKKYKLRQQRLTDEKTAQQERAQEKKNSLSGVVVGLLIGLTIAGGAFSYLGNDSKSPVSQINSAAEYSRQNTVSKQKRTEPVNRPKAVNNQPLQQNDNDSLEGLAGQLNESYPAHSDIEKARNATVFIKTSWGSGSGFFVSDNGLIITNKHVLQMQEKELNALTANADKGAKLLTSERKRIAYLRSKVSQIRDQEMRQQVLEDIRTREQEYVKYQTLHQQLLDKISDIETASPTDDVEVILIDGSTWPVSSVTISDRHDLALVSINAFGSPYLTVSSGPRDQGQKVYTVGNPHGLRHTVTAGIISGYRRYNDEPFIQTDAPINPGNSGGPLVDETGKVLGVNTMIIRDTEGIGFAIPMKSVLEEFGNYISTE